MLLHRHTHLDTYTPGEAHTRRLTKTLTQRRAQRHSGTETHLNRKTLRYPPHTHTHQTLRRDSHTLMDKDTLKYRYTHSRDAHTAETLRHARALGHSAKGPGSAVPPGRCRPTLRPRSAAANVPKFTTDLHKHFDNHLP